MSRLSVEQLQDFVNSPEFQTFWDVLGRNVYLTIDQAVRIWPASAFQNRRERRQYVRSLLKNVSLRTYLGHGGYLPLNTSDGCEVLLRSATVPVLCLPKCIENGPVLVRQGLPRPSDAEMQAICKKLRARITGTAEIRMTRVFGYSVQGMCLRDWGWGDMGISRADKTDEAMVFSAGALHRHDLNIGAHQSITIDSQTLGEILSDSNFLLSPNALLLASELLRKIAAESPQKVWGWERGDARSAGLMTAMTTSLLCPQEEGHQEVFVFAGATNFATLRRLFNVPEIEPSECRFEFW